MPGSWSADMSKLFLFACVLSLAEGAEWAVIVAGSNGYENYRHQADACHAYQIVKKKGIPESNIILMAFDDIAHAEENPFKGKIFNKPDPKGPGVDVYAGCKIDYRKKAVSPKNFIKILTGVKTGKGDNRVLNSTHDDNVFVFFADHGASGLIAFPNSELHKRDFQAALTTMHKKKMFKNLVFYLEACESGSMFKGMNIPGVYGLSASNSKESSWGTYCDHKTNRVNGKSLNTCLGDLFSVSWMEDSDVEDAHKETLEAQYEIVKKKTNKSHVMQWGDKTFTGDMLSQFLGDAQYQELGRITNSPVFDTLASAVSTREVDLHRLYEWYGHANTSLERLKAGKALQKELAKQEATDLFYHRFSALAYPNEEAREKAFHHALALPDQPDCELAVHSAIRIECAGVFDANSGFALQFHQLVVNICADIAYAGLNFDAVGAAKETCKAQSKTAAMLVV